MPSVSVRTRILAAVILPLVLVMLLVVQVIAERQRTVAATGTLHARSVALADLAVLRDRVFEERRQHETLTRSAAVGLTPESVAALLDMEVVTDPSAARSATDVALAALEPEDRPFTPATLAALRSDLDGGRLSVGDASARLDSLEALVVSGLEAMLDEVGERAVAIGHVLLDRTVRVMRDAIRAVGSRGGQIRTLSDHLFASGPDAVSSLTELAQATRQHEDLGVALASAPVRSVADAWTRPSPVGDTFDDAVTAVLQGRGDAIGGLRADGIAAPADLRQVGRVLGVPVLVAPSWLLLAAVIVLSYGPALTDRFGSTRAYIGAASFAVLLLVSVLLHEIGHCVVARAFGLPVRSITVTFLAGLTEITEPPQTPAREYAVAVIGPMVSLLLAGLGLASVQLFEPDSLPFLLAAVVALSNGMVAGFNLLPGLPLDGGRVLRAAVWEVTGDPVRSTRVAAWAGRVVAIVVVPGLLLVVLPVLNVTSVGVITLLFTALIGFFIYAGASASLHRAQLEERLPAASVALLARPALEVSADLPLAEAVRRAHEAGARALVVTDSSGRLQAVVNEAAVLATPEERRPWVTVGTVARSIEEGMVLDAALAGEPLLAAMRATPATEYVVSDPTGPVRVLVTADVAQAVTR